MNSRRTALRGSWFAIAAWLAAAAATSARAVVNPALQPNHLFERYDTVAGFRVAKIDDENRTFTLTKLSVCKGRYDAAEVAVRLAGEDLDEAFQQALRPGGVIVAFTGKRRPASEADEVLFYPGDGWWQIGRRDGTGAAWEWTRQLRPQEPGDLFGTFNGQPERLLEMMQDAAAGRYFFPAAPFARFGPDVAVGRLPGPARGVALHDLDGDGDPDVYGASEAGDRAFLQVAPLKFEDATERLGLAGLASPSVSLADANADGRPDLLAGARLLLGAGDGATAAFRASDLLPAEAGERLKCAAFVEVNGDGYPDVVVSRAGGGLRLYLNPGAAGGPFADATQAAGLDRPECGAGGNGFFAAGDWDGDGRTDLFYATGKGLFLVQDAQGRFAPAESRLQMDFTTGGEEAGLAGAGCFAPLWRPDGNELVCSSEASLNLVARLDGKPQDLTGYGNEITECTGDMLAVIAEDLDADGNVDVYAASRSGLANLYYMNRGAGSFMTPHKYDAKALPGAAHQRGAWGVAAGDADGDGANELLLGGLDGALALMPNRALDGRYGIANPKYHEKKLAEAKILAVRVSGRIGVLGARVAVVDAAGAVLQRRTIGANVATGCRGPDTVALVVREPAAARALVVRFSDGATRTWPLDLAAAGRLTVLRAAREDAPAGPAAPAGR